MMMTTSRKGRAPPTAVQTFSFKKDDDDDVMMMTTSRKGSTTPSQLPGGGIKTLDPEAARLFLTVYFEGVRVHIS